MKFAIPLSIETTTALSEGYIRVDTKLYLKVFFAIKILTVRITVCVTKKKTRDRILKLII